jgi:HEAT repeat protein
MQSNFSTVRLTALSAVWLGILSLSLSTAAFAQDETKPSNVTPPADTTDITATDRLHNSVAQNMQEAWNMLTTAVQDAKHPDLRIQSLAALGTLGNNARSEKLIIAALSDPDLDVRTAAVLAAGQTGDRNLTTNLRTMLDDKEPQVAFAAASTLWKMNDRSGEDILIAVVNGDRKATAGLKDSTLHKVGKGLHSPATLARFGALQGASLLLGPFGIGISAFEYMRKNGVDSGRAIAIELISQDKTSLVRTNLIAALGDKDPAVRAAAAKALGNYHEKDVSDALLPVFDDPKAPVHLTAAAAYIRTTEPVQKRRPTPKKL